MKTVTYTLYPINEHPHPDKCFQWIRENWHDLAHHAVEEVEQSLKAFAAQEHLTLDYCISCVPDRGEFVRFTRVPEHYSMPVEYKEDCPLTGMCWDNVILECHSLDDIESAVLKTLHAEGEYLYSDEGLQHLCEANDYHFYDSGEFAHS